MAAAGIITVGDLSGAAARDPRWYRNIPGVGPKTWEDMREKLIFFGLLQDRTREGRRIHGERGTGGGS